MDRSFAGWLDGCMIDSYSLTRWVYVYISQAHIFIIIITNLCMYICFMPFDRIIQFNHPSIQITIEPSIYLYILPISIYFWSAQWICIHMYIHVECTFKPFIVREEWQEKCITEVGRMASYLSHVSQVSTRSELD